VATILEWRSKKERPANKEKQKGQRGEESHEMPGQNPKFIPEVKLKGIRNMLKERGNFEEVG